MDRYGTCTITDAVMLAKRLSDNKNILFCYSSDQVTAHIVLITKLFEKIGTMSFGGNPEGSYCVSILYKGFYYFDLNGVDIHAGYLAEKLMLNEQDSICIAEILNAISSELMQKEN